MPTPYAREMTPELNQSYLANLLNQTDKQESIDEGRARAEGVAGGLGSQLATGAEIGLAREGAALSKTDTVNRFNMDVAGKQREERLTDEERTFRDTERQKTEDFQKQMAQMGYTFADASARRDQIAGQQGAVTGFLGSLASSAVGGYMGGLNKKS